MVTAKPIEEVEQVIGVPLAGLAHPSADGLLDQIVIIVDQHLGDRERLRGVALSDEVIRGDDGGSALTHLLGPSQLVEDVARLVEQVAADDVRRAPIHQVPRVDPVVPTDVEIEQLFATLRCRARAAGLEVHDADRPDAGLVDRAVEQDLHLVQRHVGERLRQREDIAHPRADGDIDVTGVLRPGSQVAPCRFDTFRRTQWRQPLEEPVGVQLHRARYGTSFGVAVLGNVLEAQASPLSERTPRMSWHLRTCFVSVLTAAIAVVMLAPGTATASRLEVQPVARTSASAVGEDTWKLLRATNRSRERFDLPALR